MANVTKPFGEVPLDEWAMIEQGLKEEGIIKGTGEKESEEQREKEKYEQDNVLLYDTKTVYEKREWDDFKDENPTGWGNRPGRV